MKSDLQRLLPSYSVAAPQESLTELANHPAR
jgi:hypothetical protein